MFLKHIYECNVVETVKFIDKIYSDGKDLILFTQDLLKMCKDRCIKYYIDNTNDNIDYLLELSLKLNDIYKNIKITADAKTVFEINILSFINDHCEKNINEHTVLSTESVEKEKTKKIEKDEKNISQEIISNEKEVDINSIIITNCLLTATVEAKKTIESGWKKIGDYAIDAKLGAAANFLSDGQIRAASEKEIIISFEYESSIERGNSLINSIKTLLEKIYGNHYDIVLLTNENWQKERKQFISNRDNGIKYEYKTLSGNKEKNNITKKEKKENIASQAIDLFGDDMISVN